MKIITIAIGLLVLLSFCAYAKNCGGSVACACGDTLTSTPNGWYDLSGCGGDGVIIGANNVNLDCLGKTISGIGNGAGVRVTGFDNVWVQNCEISGFSDGIVLDQADNAKIRLNSIHDNTGNGIYTSKATGEDIRHNTIDRNNIGVNLIYTSNSQIKYNTIRGNAQYGISLEGSTENNIEFNSLSGNEEIQLYLHDSSAKNTIWKNNINKGGDYNAKIDLSSRPNSWDNEGVGNHWSDYSGSGKYVIDGDETDSYPYPDNFVGCMETVSTDLALGYDITDCRFGGLTLDTDAITLDCQGHMIQGQQIYEGLMINADKVTVENCIIDGFEKGVVIGGDTNTVRANTIKRAKEFGIHLIGTSTYNMIYENDFQSSTTHAYEESVALGNFWDNQERGNTWDDFREGYPGWPDHYVISGPGDGVDYYPTSRLIDNDGDFYYANAVLIEDRDCDDYNALVNPGAFEIENCMDDDCKGMCFSDSGSGGEYTGVCFTDSDCAEGKCILFDEGFDDDFDGVANCRDYCPNDYDPHNTDSDFDHIGNVCDACPFVAGEICENPCAVTITEDTVLHDDVCSVIIAADDVELDCQNFKVYGDGSGSGIVIEGRTGIKATRCFVSNHGTGVEITSSTDVNISLNHLEGNSIGAAIDNSGLDAADYFHEIVIADNIFSDNNIAIKMLDSNNNSYMRNDIEGGDTAIYLEDRPYGLSYQVNSVSGNRISATGTGLHIKGWNWVSGNSITSNIIYSSDGDAIVLDDSQEMSISKNDVQIAGGWCIAAYDSYYLDIGENIFKDCLKGGILLEDTDRSWISKNQIELTGLSITDQAGIDIMEGSSYNDINNNRIWDAAAGIILRESDDAPVHTVISGNTISGSRDYGIRIEDSYDEIIQYNQVCNGRYAIDISRAYISSTQGYANRCCTTENWNDEGARTCTLCCSSCDYDDDGVLDCSDNCGGIANEDQFDIDDDGDGDACDCTDNMMGISEEGADCGGICSISCSEKWKRCYTNILGEEICRSTRCIPALYNGDSESRVDIVFVMARDYGDDMGKFKDDISMMIQKAYNSNKLVSDNLDRINFWYTDKKATVNLVPDGGNTNCEWSLDWGWNEDCPDASKASIIHLEECRDYSSGDGFSSEAASFGTQLHEAGHGIFGLADEYDDSPDCGTNYWKPDPFPNIFPSKEECEQKTYNSLPCVRFTTCGFILDSWHKSQPDATMMNAGCPGYPEKVCGWGPDADERVKYIFQQYLDKQEAMSMSSSSMDVGNVEISTGDEKAILAQFRYDGNSFELLNSQVVYGSAPEYLIPWEGFGITSESFTGEELHMMSMMDPRYRGYDYPPGNRGKYVEESVFTISLPFDEGLRTLSIWDTASEEEVSSIDMKDVVIDFCESVGYEDSGCQNYDSDNDGIPDIDDLCPDTRAWYAPKPAKNSFDSRNLDLKMTSGCGCDQILECKPGEDLGELATGCSPGTISVWEKGEPDSWAYACKS